MRNKIHKRVPEDEDYVIYTQPNRRRKITKKYGAAGSWSCRENQIYLHFLQNHPDMLETEFIRRSTKVFRKMSSLLRRRDPEQCRSHHQKLVIKFNGDIKGIIQRLKIKICKAKLKAEALIKKQQKNKLKMQLAQNKKEQKVKMIQDMQQEQNIFKDKLLPTGDRNSAFTGEYLMKQDCSGDIEIMFNLDFIQDW